MMTTTQLQQTIAKIDTANAQDPNMITIDGIDHPLEVAHAERRTAWVKQLRGDDCSEALLIAARGQHIRRWEIPREQYPRNRDGYLKWRNELKKFHAEKTAEIMDEADYDEATITQVKNMILKKRLKLDPDVQTLEDALCLVFLETQFSEFAQKEADKIVQIVRKTWRKMSPAGQQAALQLPMSEADRAIVEEAVSG